MFAPSPSHQMETDQVFIGKTNGSSCEESRPKPSIQPQSSTRAKPCAMPCGRLTRWSSLPGGAHCQVERLFAPSPSHQVELTARWSSLPDGAFVRTRPEPGHGFLWLGLAHQVLDQRLVGIARHVDPHARCVVEKPCPATNSETVRCQAKVILLASTMTPRSGPLADTNDDGARKATNAEAQGFLRLTTVATTQIR